MFSECDKTEGARWARTVEKKLKSSKSANHTAPFFGRFCRNFREIMRDLHDFQSFLR